MKGGNGSLADGTTEGTPSGVFDGGSDTADGTTDGTPSGVFDGGSDSIISLVDDGGTEAVLLMNKDGASDDVGVGVEVGIVVVFAGAGALVEGSSAGVFEELAIVRTVVRRDTADVWLLILTVDGTKSNGPAHRRP